RNERVGVEQEQQAHCGRRNAHVVGQCRHADQASIPGDAHQVGERDTYPDTHHHLEKGDGSKQVDQQVELALGHDDGVSFPFCPIQSSSTNTSSPCTLTGKLRTPIGAGGASTSPVLTLN